MSQSRQQPTANPPLIEICEERLALSASLAGGALLELAEMADAVTADATTAGGSASDGPSQQQPIAPANSPTTLLATPAIASTANQPTSEFNSGGDLFEQAARLRQTSGLTGAGQTIAVIDSGIAFDHIALGGGFGPGFRVVGGWDFAENDANPFDDGPFGFHGTQVSSILAGQSEGFSGIAPEADLVALRVFDDFGNSSLSYVESALQYVLENQNTFESPITTVNLSIGAALDEAGRMQAASVLGDELAALRENDILVFAAAGNFFDSLGDSESSGTPNAEILDAEILGAGTRDTENPVAETLVFPASEPSVVAVSSVGDDGALSDFAQREANIFAAPGENINGAVPDHVFGLDGNVDDFARLSGTSQAAPQLAGASVLVRQSLINEGIEPTAQAVLERLDALTQTSVDSVTGVTFRVPNLDLLGNFASESPINAPAPDSASTIPDSITAPPVIHDFVGTNGSESLELDFRGGLALRVGDQTFAVEQSTADGTVVIDVSGGNDHLLIQGSEAAERLVLHPGDGGISRITTNDLEIELRGFENVTFIGGGGPDRATLFDSTSDDTLTSHPSNASLSGVGFRFEVREVDRIFVHATAGGRDTALLHDSVGDDQLAVRPQFTSLRGEGTFQSAFGFERVLAYSNSGGVDSIELNDSAGDDTLSISSSRTVIAGQGFSVTANDFESTIANANGGGQDTARIFLDEDSQTLQRTGNQLEWLDDDASRRVIRGFEEIAAFENFEPVDLRALSLDSSISEQSAWLDSRSEAAASRSIFAALGNATG